MVGIENQKAKLTDWDAYYEALTRKTLEQFSHIADCIMDTDGRGYGAWYNKEEAINFHFLNALKCLLRMYGMSISNIDVASNSLGYDMVQDGYQEFLNLMKKYPDTPPEEELPDEQDESFD